MRIIKDFPPLFPEIKAVFPHAGANVLYAWGDVLYNPSDVSVPPELMAHEEVHGARQRRLGVDRWWKQYLDDPGFRLAEELLAHQAEYWYLRRNGNRAQRRAALSRTAKRLAAPLYGKMVRVSEAKRMLRGK